MSRPIKDITLEDCGTGPNGGKCFSFLCYSGHKLTGGDNFKEFGQLVELPENPTLLDLAKMFNVFTKYCQFADDGNR